jgi:hypothetical protein
MLVLVEKRAEQPARRKLLQRSCFSKLRRAAALLVHD